MPEKLTYEYVYNYFKKYNCELLETEYKNSATKMKYRCKCGNESEIIYNSFQKGRRCMKCSGTPKHTYKHIQEYFEKNNCILISIEYKNVSEKLEYICECGNYSEITFGNFQSGHRCMKCSGKEKYTYEYVKKCLEDENYELISDEYLGCDSELEYICNNGHIKTTTFTKFLTGYRCITCSGSEKLTLEYVKKIFKDNNYECLENEYVNNNTKMNYKCNKGHKSYITFNSFQKGNRCITCYGKEKLTLEYVKKMFKDNNYECLENEYKNANTKMRYKCDKGHFCSTTYSSFQSGTRCPKCINKTEQIVNEFLEENYTHIVSQAQFDWCKNKKCLPFDFLLYKHNLLIEVDGRQHFIQVSNWKSPEESLERDRFKMKLAIHHGYSIIRISQEDVFNNTIDWKELLKKNIKKYKKPKCIYISKDPDLYINHKF
jgi:very-short-patch-repair endonuclease